MLRSAMMVGVIALCCAGVAQSAEAQSRGGATEGWALATKGWALTAEGCALTAARSVAGGLRASRVRVSSDVRSFLRTAGSSRTAVSSIGTGTTAFSSVIAFASVTASPSTPASAWAAVSASAASASAASLTIRMTPPMVPAITPMRARFHPRDRAPMQPRRCPRCKSRTCRLAARVPPTVSSSSAARRAPAASPEARPPLSVAWARYRLLACACSIMGLWGSSHRFRRTDCSNWYRST